MPTTDHQICQQLFWLNLTTILVLHSLVITHTGYPFLHWHSNGNQMVADYHDSNSHCNCDMLLPSTRAKAKLLTRLLWILGNKRWQQAIHLLHFHASGVSTMRFCTLCLFRGCKQLLQASALQNACKKRPILGCWPLKQHPTPHSIEQIFCMHPYSLVH